MASQKKEKEKKKQETLQLETDTKEVTYVLRTEIFSSMRRVQIAVSHRGKECEIPLSTTAWTNKITIAIVIIINIIFLNIILRVERGFSDSHTMKTEGIGREIPSLPQSLSFPPNPGFLNLSPTNILDQITLCCLGCPMHCRMPSSILGLYRKLPVAPPPRL